MGKNGNKQFSNNTKNPKNPKNPKNNGKGNNRKGNNGNGNNSYSSDGIYSSYYGPSSNITSSLF